MGSVSIRNPQPAIIPAMSPRELRYLALADDLERQIREGAHGPGSRIPSIKALCSGYGVSISTASHAVHVLESRGLVDRPTNGGTRVRRLPAVIQRSQGYVGNPRLTWRAAMAEHGLIGDQVILCAGRMVAPPDVGVRLQLEAGSEVVVRRRVMLVSGHPYQLADGYHPLAVAAGTALEGPERIPRGVVAALTALGHRPVSYSEEVTSRRATGREADGLKLAAGSVVTQIMRTTRDANGPVEVAEMILPGDRFVIRYDLAADEG